MKLKNLFTIALFVVIVFISTSCSKDDSSSDTRILYPDTGFYGKNLLNNNDSIYQCDVGPAYGEGYYNSMKAILPSASSSLTVEISGTRVLVYQNHVWVIDEDFYESENTTTLYRVEGNISADLKIYLFDEGEATIKIFENDSDSPTRIKRIKKKN